jgi:hypothetical protein
MKNPFIVFKAVGTFFNPSVEGSTGQRRTPTNAADRGVVPRLLNTTWYWGYLRCHRSMPFLWYIRPTAAAEGVRHSTVDPSNPWGVTCLESVSSDPESLTRCNGELGLSWSSKDHHWIRSSKRFMTFATTTRLCYWSSSLRSWYSTSLWDRQPHSNKHIYLHHWPRIPPLSGHTKPLWPGITTFGRLYRV